MAADHSEARVVDYSRQGLWTVGRCLHASNYAKIPGWQGLPLGCALAIGYPEPAAPGNRQARADRSARSWLEASVVAMTVALRRSTVERSPLDEASAAAADNPPPALPPGIKPYLSAFQNWSGEIVVDSLWTCSVSSPEEVVMLANWARTNAYRLRPRGYSHNWSPLAIPPGTTCGDRVLLVDTTASLTTISVNPGAPASVTAQAGASMQAILSALEECGYGLTHHPAPGDLTIGGVLAIDGHGTAVPADGETLEPGHTFGSVSNLVLSITAVVWDAASDAYVLRTFRRTEPAIGALMAHLGRAFVTEVTLRVGANAMMRCRSHMDIPASEMFGAPSARGRSIEKFLAESGRVEAIWFPFTANPWLKVWTKTTTKPPSSREVGSPYNYPFSDRLSPRLTSLMGRLQVALPRLVPMLGKMQWACAAAGLAATAGWDLWGWSKNMFLYIRPDTLRVTANGYAIICRRTDVQRVIHEFTALYQSKVAEYRALHQYPMNGPVEIRVTGLDHPDDVGIAGAQPVLLSAARPRPDHPEWDCAVWLDLLAVPHTPYANRFYREVEQWCLANFTGNYASVRVEWSKGWGYTDEAAWADAAVLGVGVPASLSHGQPAGQQFCDAHAILDELDPHRIYVSPLLDTLLGPSRADQHQHQSDPTSGDRVAA
jgi:FAD/FMN-containing dehydrogenase